MMFQRPFQPFSQFFLFRRVFGGGAMSFYQVLCGRVYRDSSRFSVLGSKAPTRPLGGTPYLFRRFHVYRLGCRSFIRLIKFFVGLYCASYMFFRLAVGMTTGPYLSYLCFLFFYCLCHGFLSCPTSI